MDERRSRKLIVMKAETMEFSEVNFGAFDFGRMCPIILDSLPVAVTVTDLEGCILYFNRYSQQILDRKPEYIGRNIRRCHKEVDSIAKIDHILGEFKRDGISEFYYEASRAGTDFAVTVRPFKNEGQVLGCVHSVVIIKKNVGG
jgi:DUF438 domain-containing protein